VNFLVNPEVIEQIERYIDAYYSFESYEIIGERRKSINFFEGVEIFFTKIFGNVDDAFSWYLSKLLKKNNFTESQLIEKAYLKEDFFDILRSSEYINIPKEIIWSIVLALQLNFKETNKLLDLARCRNLYANDKRDLIVAYFIENKISDPLLLDEILKFYNLRDLNGHKNFSSEVENLIESVKNYVDENYIEPVKYSISFEIHKAKISAVLESHEKKFGDYLHDLIKQKNLSEVEVYKKAHLDRRVFSKLRNQQGYKPSKQTILAISFSLELNTDEVEDLLKHGGYALSDEDKFDLIIKYFFENKIYDLFLINEVLDYYKFKPLGG
jgi:hypothetical protein